MTTATLTRLNEVRARIDAAARSWQRDPQAITLVAVSKTFGADAIRPVLDTGHRVFGENRVQEAAGKWPELRRAFPDVALHLIGPLQTNKLRDALDLFDVIETLDRPKLAEALARARDDRGACPELMVQVNTGNEPQKAGVDPRAADAFIAHCRDALALPVTGLMCIPPHDQDPGPHFALLADIAARHDLAKLSMGMSADFEIAIQFAATHIRLGTAIFGARG